MNKRVFGAGGLFLLAVATFLAFGLSSAPAYAQSPHRLCDPAEVDCREILINHIRAENVGLDVAFWFMEDHWIASEIINRWKAGVPVRILMDTEANSPNPINAHRLAEFQAAGIPMRERTTSGILHWKMMLFAGQNLVEFSGANYSSDAWHPQTTTLYENYVDEIIVFTSDTSIVNSFKTKYDDLWTNTTQYTNYRNITRPLWRVYPTYPIDERMNFVPDQSHYGRAAAEYRREPTAIDVTMYRITDFRFTEEMIAAKNRGVRVRLLTEPQQYRDIRRLWHSYNIDVLYMNGIDIRHRVHAGLNHQKSVVLRGLNLGIVGSSNWSSASAEYQEEHNLFTTDPFIYDWMVAQFERKWNNSTGVQEYGPFAPLPPGQATTPSPAASATNIPVDNVVLAWDAGPWAHRYDVYLGTSSASMQPVASDVNLGPSQWTGDFKSVAVPHSLLPGTTYYWQVVSRTMANMTTSSPVWTFTTAGTATPPPTSTVTVVRQPYLQQVTSTAATVVWATRESGAAQLRVTAPGGTTTTANASSTLVPASATGLSADYYQHVARVEGLAAASTYQYDIFLNSTDLNPGVDTLRTAPARGSGTVSFVAFGDSGTGSTEQRQIAAMLAGDSFDFAVHGGDVAYGNTGGTGGATYQTMDDWFFSVYGGWLRSRPMFPSMGNHDSRAENGNGRPYLDLFVLPGHGATSAYPDHAERYYSFDYGPVHVVVLDTEFAFQDPARRAAQLTWLEADLNATTQPWKVAVFHRSPYSAGGEHGSDLVVREVFGTVFDRYGVQLAISAHEHDYERTVPMRAGAPTTGGTTYIVSGGGGGPLYPAGTGTWTAYSASVHHYLKATVTECTLRVDAISISGGALDRVDLSRCSAPVPLPAPWTSRDIGAVGPAGSATHSSGTFTIKGAGADIWDSADAFHYVSQPVSGDVDIVARVNSIEYVSTWVKAGVMIREALTPQSAHALMLVSPGKGLAFQRRVATGGISTHTSGGTGTAPNWVKLERRGNTITAFRSPDGATWTLVGSDTFTMGANVQVGLAVSSHDATRLAEAVFDNVTVRLVGTPPANVAPNVAISTPVNGATFTAPATIGISATASDSDGTVARVDFYSGATLLGSDTASPFQWTWSNVPAGTYSLTTRATDDDGAVKTSTAVSITVNNPANVAPNVAISTPVNGATFTAPATIGISATASDSDGTVARVDFYSGATLLGSDTASPFQWTWSNVPAGTYSLTARATDNGGAVTSSSPVSITVNNPANVAPSVAISTPVNGATFTAPATVGISATASDSDGTVARVDFYSGATLLGSDTSSPFQWTWSNVPAGTYSLTARATDNGGAVTNSSPVSITVNNPANVAPSVAISTPVNGATFTAPATIGISATASDSDGTVARVDFYSGATLLGSDTASPFQWTWNNVPAGTYSLTARATDNGGAVTNSSPVSITVNDPTPPPSSGLPAPWSSQDIGAVGVAGSASEAGGTFTVKGAGADIWNSSDAFYYVWRPLSGDADIIARVVSVEYVRNWVKAGVMIRQSLTPDSAHALMLVSSGKGLAFQRRVATGGSSTNTSGGAGTAPNWVKLQRRGNTITAYRSPDGVTWTLVGSDSFAMPANVYVGLAVSSHDASRTATVTFDNVSLVTSTAPPPPPPNASPSVALTSPTNGSTFTAPASVALTASASDSDGTVARVDFYAGTTLLGSDTSSPFQWTWGNVPAGTYSLTARATDDDGAVTTSTAVSITVNNPTAANVPPTVSISSPVSGATFTAPASVAIAASAADSDGTVTRVDFYNGSTLLGSDTTSPFQFTWSSVPAGTYSLTARALDNGGATTMSAAVSITVTDPAPPPSGLPLPWQSQDIGNVGPAGSATHSGTTFTVRGAGADIWYYADAFHFVWQPITGNVDIVARVTSTEYVHDWVKGAVMIREQLTPESAHAMMLVSPGKGLAFQRRVATWGASTNTSGGAGTAPAWVKLERRGTTITAYRSADGVTWTLVGSDTFSMATNIYVGLAVTSHDATRLATVTFDNVSVIPR